MKAIFNFRKHNDIADLQSDDPAVFGRFIKNHQDTVFGFLGRMGFSQFDAEDLAQETFLRVWRNRYSYQPDRAKISTWLCTITRNLALNEIDKRNRRPVPADISTETLIASDPATSPEQQLDASQKIDLLNDALQQLSIEDRSAIALHYVEELTTKEAAKVMGCNTGTFRTRLSRARQKLQVIWNSQIIQGNEPS